MICPGCTQTLTTDWDAFSHGVIHGMGDEAPDAIEDLVAEARREYDRRAQPTR